MTPSKTLLAAVGTSLLVGCTVQPVAYYPNNHYGYGVPMQQNFGCAMSEADMRHNATFVRRIATGNRSTDIKRLVGPERQSVLTMQTGETVDVLYYMVGNASYGGNWTAGSDYGLLPIAVSQNTGRVLAMGHTEMQNLRSRTLYAESEVATSSCAAMRWNGNAWQSPYSVGWMQPRATWVGNNQTMVW